MPPIDVEKEDAQIFGVVRINTPKLS